MEGREDKRIKGYGFGKVNLYIALASVAVLVVGYLLLAGGKSDDGVSFNEEVFNRTRIGVAPVVLTLGYVGLLVALLWRGKGVKKSSGEEEK